jgi:methionyl aminopeptidase
VSVGSRKDVQALLAAGRVVAEALARMRALVRPGATTAELDRAAAEVFARHGARSAPQLAYDFPGVTCISVNDEAVHGIPGSRRIAPGDLVKLDVTAELRGYMADAAVTVPVPPVAGQGDPLTDGLVITIEPIISARTRTTRRGGDGWTVATADGRRSAHVEHTIIVRRGRPLVLTA